LYGLLEQPFLIGKQVKQILIQKV